MKFDSDGYIVSTQVASGQVLRIDPRSGEQTLLAQLTPGLDNLTLVDGRLFVSNFTGEITEILGGGETRTVLPGGLNWPLDLAVGDDGQLYVADGTYFYVVAPDGSLQTVGMLVLAGLPGIPPRPRPRGRRRVRGDHIRRPGRPVPARRERNRLSRRPIRPALRCRDRPGRCDRVRRARHRAGPRPAVRQRRDAGLRPAGSGRRRLRPGRRAAGRRVGCGPGGETDRLRLRGRGGRTAAARRASWCGTGSSTSSTPAPRRSSRST